MASSQSGMAQTLTMCQFCEESPDIKWKCVNCELFLCQPCSSKIHSKSKAAMEHEIINTRDFGIQDFATSVRKVELENLVCTIHAKQKCFVFCKDCSQPACSKCLTETHKMHDYEALDERYGEIISEMKELMKKIDSNLQFYKNEKDKLQNKIFIGDNNYKQTRDSILQTEKEMIEAISKHAKELLKKLEAKWKLSENMIKTELSAITKREEDLETRNKNLDQALKSHQVKDIFSTSKTLDKSLQKYPAKIINSIRTKFIHRYITVNKGNPLVLGDIYTVPEIEVIGTFHCDVVNVTNIKFCSDNIAFLGSFGNQKLQKVKFENQIIKLLGELQVHMCDIAQTQNGDIIVSSGKSEITLFAKDGQLSFKSFKQFSPLKTSCVHITKDNKIIVGLIESSPIILPPPNDSIRRLVIMSQDDDIQHTIEYDRDHQRLFTYPFRIKTFNDNMVVVDIMNREGEGRVVMLDYGGSLHWPYNGCKTVSSVQTKFYPKDVAITSTDMIVVSDSVNHSLHVLNHAGEVIVCTNVKSLGIELPFSLEYDKNDILWIGCTKQAIDKSKKAKIHCVKFT